MSTFSDFKKDFYSRIGDASLFDCGDINLLKVVLDGLRVRYAEKGPLHTPLFDSPAAHRRFLWLRRLKMKFNGEASSAAAALEKIARLPHKDVLVIDHSGRFAIDDHGKQRSLYFDRIAGALTGRCFFVLEFKGRREFPYDLHFPLVSKSLQVRPMSDDVLALRERINETYSRIVAAKIFSPEELSNIRAAFQLFFDYYRAWYGLAELLRPRLLVFGQHYHREGLLLAMKKLGVISVELQHGLIAEEDVFYLFPSSVRDVLPKALFADRILVYGDFWKQRLLKGFEYPASSIGTIGYYHFEASAVNTSLRESLEKFKNGSRLLLVTTQTSLHPYFIASLDWLANDIRERGLAWKIIVKPHPAEQKGVYNPLKAHDNIRIVEANLEQLFPLCDLHLSVYSTTLFDAIRFGIKSYALYVPEYGDYVDSMIAAGVAEKVEDKTNFLVAAENTIAVPLNREYYYSNFEPAALPAILDRIANAASPGK